jgi:hypothetical protein
VAGIEAQSCDVVQEDVLDGMQMPVSQICPAAHPSVAVQATQLPPEPQ